MSERFIAVTISGTDFNGFVWQNVFHLTSDDMDHNAADHLAAVNEWVNTTLLPDLLDAMSNQVTILDIASKYVKPDSSYTVHKSVNSPGTRDVEMDTGAVAGVIQWYPFNGPQTGRQYITGTVAGDYANDYITDDYKALLETARDAFLNLTGTDATYTFSFVLYSRGTDVIEPSVDAIFRGVVISKIGVLSKRVRA